MLRFPLRRALPRAVVLAVAVALVPLPVSAGALSTPQKPTQPPLRWPESSSQLSHCERRSKDRYSRLQSDGDVAQHFTSLNAGISADYDCRQGVARVLQVGCRYRGAGCCRRRSGLRPVLQSHDRINSPGKE